MFYVYMLRSEVDNSFYKGFTENPLQRLLQHNNGESNYTSKKIPWKLVYVEAFNAKREALIREKNLKKATLDRIEVLLLHPKNIVSNLSSREHFSNQFTAIKGISSYRFKSLQHKK